MCVEPGELAVRDVPDRIPEPDAIEIDVCSVGICGTDFHILLGKHPFLTYPIVLGHEISGRVVADSDDGRFAAGDLVVVNPYMSCGKCRACLAGKPNCCESLSVLGVHVDGGLRARIPIPAGNLYPADGLNERSASMVEFLAVGAHGVRRAGDCSGKGVLVVGAGPIGIGAALFARMAGGSITFRDVSETRLDLATSILPADISLVGDGHDDRLRSAFDIVIDATGNAGSMSRSLDYLAHGGTYVLLGVVNDTLSFSDPDIHKREASIHASRNAVREDFYTVMNAMRAGDIPVDKLNTHATDFDNAADAMMAWVNDRESLVKATVRL